MVDIAWRRVPIARFFGFFVFAVVLGGLGAKVLYGFSTGLMASLDAFVIVSAMFFVAVWDGFIAAPGHYGPPKWLRDRFLAFLIGVTFVAGILFGARCW
jgi:hypothetical protein